VELLEIVRDVRDVAVVVHAKGEVDTGTVEMLSAALDAAVIEGASHPARLLVVELNEVTYFGSAGLNALLNCSEKARAEAVTVCVVATNSEVIRPIEVTKLDGVLPLYATLAQAYATPKDAQ
jgi:anti-sigma B factor antagonist